MTPQTRPVPKVKAIECPNCGGSMELRGLGTSLHAACVHCLSLLDVSHEKIKLIQRYRDAMHRPSKIPLGARGKIQGKTFEVLGFQVRGIFVDGIQYTWDEYVLFNPYHGFRYLSEYAGHWTLIEPMSWVPEPVGGLTGGVRDQGRTYRLFQTAEAKTIYVIGEFPWRVHLNDTVTAKDYTAAPYSLSAEVSGMEVNWSRGQYISGKEIWQAFQLPDSPPRPEGVYFNQPNPYPSAKPMWAISLLFTLALIVAMIMTSLLARDERVFKSNFYFTPGQAEPSFVTKSFDLKGGEDNIEVELKTDLANNWAYFDFALINEETGTAYNFGKEVSYYSGRDSDGSWTEGDTNESVRIGGIPGGRYYLRVEPEMDKPQVTGIFSSSQRVNYEISVIRGASVIWPYFLAMPFLWILPILSIMRHFGFESKRWAESDPQGSGSGSSGDDDDDDDE